MRAFHGTRREWWACFFGKPATPVKTWAPYPYPDAYNCPRCGKLLYMLDGEIRYSCLEQWLEERT